MSNNISKIKQFAAYVDQTKNGGNGNHYVDGSEIEVFKKKVKTLDKNIDVDKILEDYNSNKVQYEAEYDENGTKSNSSVETAVIAAFNETTSLKTNDKKVNTASTIKEGIKTFDKGFWDSIKAWWNDDEDLLNFTSMIDENNVLDVVADDEVVSKIVNADDEVKNQAAASVLNSLISAANEKQIDVSNIVIEKDGEYAVGRDVEGKEFGSPALDEDNIEAVIKALRDAVDTGKDTVTNKNNNKEAMLTMWAKRIDSENFGGNGNGYIDTPEETEQLKQIAAKYGFDIDTVLEEIRDNETNGVENTTSMQKTVYNIFDPEQRAAMQAEDESNTKNVSKALADGIANDNQELLEWAASNINSDNVMDILSANPDAVQKLVNEYDYNGFVNFFGYSDDYQKYTTPIISSLYQYAQDNGIDVDDIVMVNGDKMITGSAITTSKVGSDATDADNVSAVITALQNRINEELA